MLLIADSGSTKTDWALIDGPQVRTFSTDGINPVYVSGDLIKKIVEKELPFNRENIVAVYFYGAGCIQGKTGTLGRNLAEIFGKAKVSVNSDLLGAARSLYGERTGIASILGTGSNTGYYNGKKITDSIPSMGYILGDEGSGAVMGKKLVSAIYKRRMSQEITDLFFSEYTISYPKLIEFVYRQPLPNRFLAQFTRFISKNISHPEIRELVKNCFMEFIEFNLLKYDNVEDTPVSFTGSIAYHFSDQLRESLAQYSITVGEITRTPIEGLIKYHTKI
ncbi:MAG: ATPase [Rikenellaceae bacterium]|nr:ATPase [Rikenellaceae bacterium]